MAKLSESDDRRHQIIRDEEELRFKLQDHIKRLEEKVSREKYDRSAIEIHADSKIKTKELQN